MISAPSNTCEAPIRPGHRRAHLGVFDAELRLGDRRSARTDLRCRLLRRGDGVVVDLLADRVLGQERPVALDVLPGTGQVGLGGGEVRLGRGNLRAVLARVDRVEELALVDHGAVGEVLFREHAAHAGADLDLLRAAHFADQVPVDFRRRQGDRDDLHFDGRRARGGRVATATGGEGAPERE